MPKKMIGIMIAISVISAVVGGGVGFVAAQKMLLSKMTQADVPNMAFGQGMQGSSGGRQFVTSKGGNGQGNGPRMAGDFAGRGTFGEITAMDDKSITVKMPDGGSKIVMLADSTTFEATTKAQKSELKTGQHVRVTGSTNSDGSLTAQTVMLNPPMPIMVNGTPGTPANSAAPTTAPAEKK
jgi:hypothetical protein